MATEFGGKIKLEGEAEYRSALSKVNSELKLLSKEMQNNGSSADTMAKKQDLLSQKIETQRKNVLNLENALQKAKQRYGENSIEVQKWETRLNSAKSKLIDFEKELKNASDDLDTVSRKFLQSSQDLEKAGSTLVSTGSGLSKTLSSGATAAGVASGKMAMDFENSFARVTTLINDEKVNLESLQDDIKAVSSDMNVPTEEFNAGLYQALSSGVEISQNYSNTLDFMAKNAKVAVAGQTDIETAIDTTTSILNAYNMKLEETDRIHETLINTQDLGKTTVREMGANLSDVIPTAANLNIEIEQVGAAFAAMTAQGVPTAQTATQIRSMLSELSKEGQTAYDNFERLTGKSFKQFIADGGTLVEAMQIMKDGAADAGVELNSMFSSIEAANAALILTSDSGAKLFTDSLQTMRTSTSAVDNEFEKMAGTTEYQFAKALNKALNSFKDMGTVLLPVVNNLSGGISNLSDWINGLDDDSKKAVAQFVIWTATMGPLLVVFGKFSTALSSGITFVSSFIKALKSGQTAMTAFTAACSTNPVTALITVLGVAASAFVSFKIASAATAEEIETVTDKIDEQRKSYEESTKTIDDNATSRMAELEVCENQIAKLDALSKKTSLTAGEEKQLNQIIENLNEAMPDLNLHIDEQTGKLNLNTEAIRNNIAAYKDMAEAQVYQDKLLNATEAKIGAESNYDEAVRNAANEYYRLMNENAGESTGALVQERFGSIISKLQRGQEISQAELDEATRPDANGKMMQFTGLAVLVEQARIASEEVEKYSDDVDEYSKKISDSYSNISDTLGDDGGDDTGGGGSTKASTTSELEDWQQKSIDNWEYLYQSGQVSAQEYYNALTRIRDNFFTYDSEGWRDYNLKIISLGEQLTDEKTKQAEEAAKAAEEAAKTEQERVQAQYEQELSDLEFYHNMGRISEEQYYASLAQIRDKYLTEDSEEWRQHTLAIKQYQDSVAKEAYTSQQNYNYNWIDERIANNDWDKFNTDEEASYNRILQRAKDAYNQRIITAEEYVDELDRIVTERKNDYTSQKQKSSDWIADRNFYDDWEQFNTTEEESYKRMLARADEYYAKGVLSYQEYLDEVRELNKSIYTAQADEQEVIYNQAEERMTQMLADRKAEMDEQISALNKQVSDLRAKYTTENRNKELSELQEEASHYRNAGTLAGQSRYEELTDQIEQLQQEAEIEALERKNSEIIAKLQADYEQAEALKESLLTKIADNTSKFDIDALINGLSSIISGAVVKAINTTNVTNNTYNNSNTNNVTQNNNINDNADAEAIINSVLRRLD